ncbi:uncharacterized protein HKW66_Vig0079150 [Vigna angularis]|uniref:Uncharacterized protein n=1 Tax=Phaseolus angularis TaxID=3914 RepID=A0A8T0K4R8_PHAAN|nr:uncharacterized protein HKW66_Vig0079150 [Vigna angularis]
MNDKRNKKLEVKWTKNECCNDGMDVNASLLQRLSIASFPRFSGFDQSASVGTSSVAGRMSFIGADNLQFKDIVYSLFTLFGY